MTYGLQAVLQLSISHTYGSLGPFSVAYHLDARPDGPCTCNIATRCTAHTNRTLGQGCAGSTSEEPNFWGTFSSRTNAKPGTVELYFHMNGTEAVQIETPKCISEKS